MDIEIEHYTRLAGTPGEMLAIEGLYETARAGHLQGLHVAPTDEVIVAFADGDPVALVIFTEYASAELWIHLGYCRPAFRRKGHYRACIEQLKQIAAARGYQRINTATHPRNMGAIKSIESRGGKVQYVAYVFPVR